MIIQGPTRCQQLTRLQRLGIGELLLQKSALLQEQLQLCLSHLGVTQGVGGLGMLMHQGPLAWELWFGITPSVTPKLQALLEKSLQA
jgi:hypothetical protein